jgi:hypothetical protein
MRAVLHLLNHGVLLVGTLYLTHGSIGVFGYCAIRLLPTSRRSRHVR